MSSLSRQEALKPKPPPTPRPPPGVLMSSWFRTLVNSLRPCGLHQRWGCLYGQCLKWPGTKPVVNQSAKAQNARIFVRAHREGTIFLHTLLSSSRRFGGNSGRELRVFFWSLIEKDKNSSNEILRWWDVGSMCKKM